MPELIIVILVTLGLASAFVLGLKFFNDGHDRAYCIHSINNVQKSVRFLQNSLKVKSGESSPELNYRELWGEERSFLSSKPVCPRHSTLIDHPRGNLDGVNDNYAYNTAGGTGEGTFPNTGYCYIICIPRVSSSDPSPHHPSEVDGVPNKTQFDGGGH